MIYKTPAFHITTTIISVDTLFLLSIVITWNVTSAWMMKPHLVLPSKEVSLRGIDVCTSALPATRESENSVVAPTSSTTTAKNNNDDDGDDGSNKDYSYWRVYATIDKLKTNGIRLSSSASQTSTLNNSDKQTTTTTTIHEITKQVISILQQLTTNYAGKKEWVGILNKSTLLDEVEESIVMLSLLTNHLEENSEEDEEEPLTIVDVCCGKGIFSLLASYILQPSKYNVQSIVLLDKADICWDHIHAANQDNILLSENKNSSNNNKRQRRPIMTIWDNCNLHETDALQTKIQTEIKGKCILVGIHLCKTLSPSCISLANTLGRDVCIGLFLMPCCLPRVVFRDQNIQKKKSNNSSSNSNSNKNNGSFIQVRQYETTSQKQKRQESKQHRINAKQRIPPNCYLCSSPNHRIHQCNLLPSDQYEQITIFAKAAAAQPCWKCGQVGHFKSNCPSNQSTDKPSLVQPPLTNVDVSGVLKAKEPFKTYVELLGGSIQFDHVALVDTGLYNDSANHLQITWNSNRKSLCLIGENKR